jgi:hypothetical protein
MPAAIPRKKAETISARKALSFVFIIKKTIRAIDANKTINIHVTLLIVLPPKLLIMTNLRTHLTLLLIYIISADGTRSYPLHPLPSENESPRTPRDNLD